MAIRKLYTKYRYPAGGTDLPVVIMIHGFSGNGSDYINEHMDSLAGSDLFMVSVGMRGRDGAQGTKDASGREIYDIYDALIYLRAKFPGIVSSDKAALLGFSGGGGNALAAACKFPDAWNVVVDMWGMSDYGRDGTNGWYQQNSFYQSFLVTDVGGTPAQVPNNYYARDATAAITNFSGGKLHMFHDEADTTVRPIQSARIATAMDGAGLTNYSYNLSLTTDPTRWQHGLDGNLTNLLAAQAIWKPDILTTAAWTIPASGSVTVIGYIVTKRFTIWLNTNGTATKGIDGVATVVYDTTTDTYTVTPLTTGGLDVEITQGAKTGTATNITSETQIVVI